MQELKFGILPEIWGTLYSSLLALLIGGFFGLGVAIFLTQDFLPPRLALVFRTDHRAARRDPERGLRAVGDLRRHSGDPAGGELAQRISGLDPVLRHVAERPGLVPAAMVLAIMVLPTVAGDLAGRAALGAVPDKEAAYGMGTTRWEAILKVMVPTAASGIFGALVLGFGRALGETMALAMLIGNANQISLSLFSPANTLAALLASHFPEAGPAEVEVLMYAALVLLAITLVVNVVGIGDHDALTQRKMSGKA